MSGHSKWATIKRAKESKDAQRGNIFTKLGNTITMAAKEGGADPEANFKLRLAIERAKSVNMPKDNIERAIERGSSGIEAGTLKEVLYEAYGPGGAALLIEGLTDNKNRTTNEIKHTLSEHGGKLAGEGSVEWMFEKRGAVDVPEEKNNQAHDDLPLALIDAGATDIKNYEKGVTAYIEPQHIESFKEALIQKGIAFGDIYIDRLPKTQLPASAKERVALEKLIAVLDENEDVQEIYTNVNL